MTTSTVTRLIDPDATCLAWGKSKAGIPITRSQARLIVLDVARRCWTLGTTDCLAGDEWAILRRLGNGHLDDLVAAFGDWQECEDNPDEWRHRSDVVDTEPMGRGEALDFTAQRLEDAVETWLGAGWAT